MEIDQLSTEEMTRLRKEGRCYRCHEKGHLSKECPNKGKTAIRTTTIAEDPLEQIRTLY